MECKNEAADNLEQLLETLIRMVGNNNQHIDTLRRRVSHLESQLKEQQQLLGRKEFILTKTSE